MKRIFSKKPKLYSNPYLVGVGLGFVLLSAFVIMGRGLGASGGLTSILTAALNSFSPEYVSSNSMYSEYVQIKYNPLKDWLVFEIIGIFIGATISGFFAGRINLKIEKGDSVNSKIRLVTAFIGGILMGFAAKMARGCTSGQALTGGALMSLGSWIFMLSVFIGGYAVAYFVRRLWI